MKKIKNPTTKATLGAIETTMDFSFFPVSEEMQGPIIQQWLETSWYRISSKLLKSFLGKNFERKTINDKQSSIYETFFFILSSFSFPIVIGTF